MKRSINRSIKRSIMFTAIATVAVVGFAAFASQAAKQPLFISAKAPAGLTADASYLALANDRATVSLDVVQADAAQISGASDTLQVSVGPRSLVASKQTFTRNPDGTTVWQGSLGANLGMFAKLRARFSGEVLDDPNNEVTIVRNGNKLTGTMRIDGNLYALRPLRSGGHAIARIDQSKMPADHPGEYAMLPRIPMPRTPVAKAGQIGTAAVPITYTIRVISMATQSASTASGDIVGLVNLAITETNQSYANSGIDRKSVV